MLLHLSHAPGGTAVLDFFPHPRLVSCPSQACLANEVTEPECALKAIEYWSRAADAAYDASSLVEALRCGGS